MTCGKPAPAFASADANSVRGSKPTPFSERNNRTARTFQYRALGLSTRENAQKARRLCGIDVRRDCLAALARDGASPEKSLKLPHTVGNNFGDIRVARRNFLRGIGQKTDEALFERAFNDFSQERLDRRSRRQRVLQT